LLMNRINQRRSLLQEKKAHNKGVIESVLSEALKIVYGDQYNVEMTYAVKGNRSHMEIEVVKGDVRRTIGGFGGGVCDTLSVPLKILILLGSKQTAKICVLDEAWKHVDLGRIELVAEFVKDICSTLGIQIILLSHHEAFKEHAKTINTISGKS